MGQLPKFNTENEDLRGCNRVEYYNVFDSRRILRLIAFFFAVGVDQRAVVDTL